MEKEAATFVRRFLFHRHKHSHHRKKWGVNYVKYNC